MKQMFEDWFSLLALIYAIVVFFFPWTMLAYQILKCRGTMARRGYIKFLPMSPFDLWKELQGSKQAKTEDPEIRSEYRKVMKWGAITVACWIVGFFVPFATIYRHVEKGKHEDPTTPFRVPAEAGL